MSSNCNTLIKVTCHLLNKAYICLILFHFFDRFSLQFLSFNSYWFILFYLFGEFQFDNSFMFYCLLISSLPLTTHCYHMERFIDYSHSTFELATAVYSSGWHFNLTKCVQFCIF